MADGDNLNQADAHPFPEAVRTLASLISHQGSIQPPGQ